MRLNLELVKYTGSISLINIDKISKIRIGDDDSIVQYHMLDGTIIPNNFFLPDYVLTVDDVRTNKDNKQAVVLQNISETYNPIILLHFLSDAENEQTVFINLDSKFKNKIMETLKQRQISRDYPHSIIRFVPFFDHYIIDQPVYNNNWLILMIQYIKGLHTITDHITEKLETLIYRVTKRNDEDEFGLICQLHDEIRKRPDPSIVKVKEILDHIHRAAHNITRSETPPPKTSRQ